MHRRRLRKLECPEKGFGQEKASFLVDARSITHLVCRYISRHLVDALPIYPLPPAKGGGDSQLDLAYSIRAISGHLLGAPLSPPSTYSQSHWYTLKSMNAIVIIVILTTASNTPFSS